MVVAIAPRHSRIQSICEMPMSAYVVHTFARVAASAALVLSFNVLAADPTPDPAEPYAIGSGIPMSDTARPG